MTRNISALLVGVLFGFGLSLSTMTDRHRVLAFLDVAGDWDPTLMLVMGGAVLVTLVVFRLILRRPAPLLDEHFHLPKKTHLDRDLVLGAAIFGIGWGIGGFCPGPGLAGLWSLAPNPLIFSTCLVAGGLLAGVFTVPSGR